MKKILITLIALAIAANAGIFSTISGMTMEQIKPTQEYTVDTAGVNPRIYQWKPKGLPGYICIAIFTNSSENAAAPAMQCFKVKK